MKTAWVTLFLAASAWAQEEAAPEAGASPHQFGASMRIEYWESDLDIDDASTSLGAVGRAALVGGVEMDVDHTATVFAGEYDYRGWGPLTVGGHLGLAWERITASQDLPSTHPDPKGPFTRTTGFDDGFMWEVGIKGGYHVDDVDFDLVLTYRAGGSDAGDKSDDLDYDYWAMRVAVEGGYTVARGIRPFLQVRFTDYSAEWEVRTGGATFTYDLELDDPIGVSLGVDLSTLTMRSRIELLLIDGTGIIGTVGWAF